MCYVIYFSLIGLVWLYADSVINDYALSISAGSDQWTLVALSWEIIPILWPVWLLFMVIASAVTFFISRIIHQRS